MKWRSAPVLCPSLLLLCLTGCTTAAAQSPQLFSLSSSLPASATVGQTLENRAGGVEKLEGTWKVEPLGAGTTGVDYIRFGAANSAQWFHFESKDECWTTRHRYRLVRERVIFTPELASGRSWWQPNFETPSRIDLLERSKTEDGRSSQRVRLVRASIPDADCEMREAE